MAAVCLRTWGETRFAAIDGHFRAAVAAYLATNHSTASALSGPPRQVGKSGAVSVPGPLFHPLTHDRHGSSCQRRDAVLAPFSVALHVWPRRELDVTAGEDSQLADSQPCLDGEHEQRVISPSDPRSPFGRGEQRIHLRCCEEADLGPVVAFVGDGQDSLD